MKARKLNFNFTRFFTGRIALVFILTGLAAAFGQVNISAQTQFSELTKINLKNFRSQANFGSSVSIDGTTVIAGAPNLSYTADNSNEGGAFIYTRNASGAWVLQQQLNPSTLSANYKFGSCVDISGDTAIVGAPGNEAVFVFVRSGGTWTQQQRIVKGGSPSGFGMKCAISGDSLIVGSRNEAGGPAGGAAYIFARSGGVWTQQTRLTGFAGTTCILGDFVAIDGNTAVLGEPGCGAGGNGSIQIYVRSGASWIEQQRLTTVTGSISVAGNAAISGDTLVATARGVVNASNGAAYVFVRSGSVWTPQQALVPSNTGTNPNFGSSLAVNGNTIIIGAWADISVGGEGAGSAFIFQRSGTIWTETQKIFSSDLHAGDHFGWSVDVSGANAVVGANGDGIGALTELGSAYMFASNPANCTFSLSPTRSSLFPAAGGAGSFTVTTQAGCQWQATVQDNISWVTTSDAGTGSGTVNFNVAANAGKARRAEISINGRNVYTLSQSGGVSSQSGDLDPNFGNAGLITNRIFQTNEANGVAVQADGKIVVVGGSFNPGGTTFAQVIRYNTDGTLDQTFGTGGVVTTQMGFTGNRFADVVIQPDGKIVAGGTTQPSGANSDFAVVRYNSNGTLDTTFGTNGIVITDFGSSNDLLTAVALAPDGKIFVTGGNFTGNSFTARYNTNGTLDTAFGTSGKLTVSDAGNNFPDAAVQTDGKIVVASQDLSGRTVVLRINANGTLDTTFGTSGRATINSSGGNAIAIASDGKIVIGLNGSDSGGNIDFAVARLNAGGTLDSTFGTNGIAQANFGFPVIGESFTTDILADIALQPDGKIIAVGYVQSNQFSSQPPTHTGVARFNANGSLDSTFGTNGRKTTAPDDLRLLDDYDQPKAVAVAPDGKIVVAGDYRFRVGQQDVMVLRLLGEGAATARAKFDFDGDGRADLAVFRPSNGVWYLQQSTNGFTGIQFGIATDKIVPADYDGDGKTDLAVYRSGVWYLQRSSLGFTGISFGLSDDIPMPADYDGDGKDDLGVFRPSTGIWYLQQSTNGFTGIQFGTTGDVPAAADYDADNKADLAVFRPSSGVWYLQRSQAGFTGISFGSNGDKPVAADYDGDGKADIAVFRPSNSVWYLNRSQLGFTGIQFGISSDLPTPADYDGDGKTDIAVFRPSAGAWYLQRSTLGFTGIGFGISEDRPIPNAFVP